jgi:hypothetical protein
MNQWNIRICHQLTSQLMQPKLKLNKANKESADIRADSIFGDWAKVDQVSLPCRETNPVLGRTKKDGHVAARFVLYGWKWNLDTGFSPQGWNRKIYIGMLMESVPTVFNCKVLLDVYCTMSNEIHVDLRATQGIWVVFRYLGRFSRAFQQIWNPVGVFSITYLIG